MSKEYPDECLPSYNSIYSKDILKGKYAFITGGGSGINFRITEGLMAHGCNVAIASRNIERVKIAKLRLLSSYPNVQCLALQMDVSKPEQVEQTVKEILNTFPRIDILINGAAGNFLCPAEELSANAFKRVHEIDTLGTFYTSKYVFENSMKHNKNGCIINITATLYYRGDMLQLHAGSAKAAIDAMTTHLATEWGRYNVRVLSVAPGPIENTTGFHKLGGFASNHEKENNMMTKIQKHIPLRRLGTTKDIADTCIFLVSDAASYISGTVIVVDGGSWLTSGTEFQNMLLDNPQLKQTIPGRKKDVISKSKL